MSRLRISRHGPPKGGSLVLNSWFLTVHMLLTPLRMVLVLLYPISQSFTVVNTLVSRHDKSFVVHLLEQAIKQCLKGTLCNFEVQYK